jgi:hypothetical protein
MSAANRGLSPWVPPTLRVGSSPWVARRSAAGLRLQVRRLSEPTPLGFPTTPNRVATQPLRHSTTSASPQVRRLSEPTPPGSATTPSHVATRPLRPRALVSEPHADDERSESWALALGSPTLRVGSWRSPHARDERRESRDLFRYVGSPSRHLRASLPRLQTSPLSHFATRPLLSSTIY